MDIFLNYELDITMVIISKENGFTISLMDTVFCVQHTAWSMMENFLKDWSTGKEHAGFQMMTYTKDNGREDIDGERASVGNILLDFSFSHCDSSSFLSSSFILFLISSLFYVA